ncbi:MAG: TraM recognition domain-containing protein [Desulfovibrio sp.]|nr:TraM recognition domain-containing protein [Desulfovibrio sp.]
MADYLYGLQKEQEKRKESVLRDVRTDAERFLAGLCRRWASGTVLLALALASALWSMLWPLCLGTALALFFFRYLTVCSETLPMRLPSHARTLDYALPKPGKRSAGFQKASGIFYLGNEDGSNCELWITKEDLVTHLLCLGTTGAGKTETLISLCFNYLALGSGFIYVDPKAAPRLAAQIWTMARMLGRDDDFLLINYMADKSAQESLRRHAHCRTPLRQSNTQNPFAVGDANSLTQLLFALMPGEDKGQGQIFANNAQTLISGLLFVLVERRDLGLEPLSIDVIRSYLMDVPKIDALARESRYSETATLALQAGLATVGWDKSRDLEHQAKSFPEQYAYARAYFGRALSLLVDNYGRIFRAQCGEVDATDVITNRRIFVSLIPSMDKDPKELKSLGQVCLAQVRNACAVGLGDTVQGPLSEVLQSLPTESQVPFGIIVDEYAAIETPGFEILLTQGRGLGMSVVIASQDFAGIRRSSEGAAEQIISNCKVKLFMATEDPRQTTDLAQQLAGRAFVLKSSGFSVRRHQHVYQDNLTVSAESMQRVDFRDLQRQVQGQVTIAFRGEIIRGYTFFANPPLAATQSLRLNYQLQLAEPNLDYQLGQFGSVKRLLAALAGRLEEKQLESEDGEDLSAAFEHDSESIQEEGADQEALFNHALLQKLEAILCRQDLGQAATRAIVALWQVEASGEDVPGKGAHWAEKAVKVAEADVEPPDYLALESKQAEEEALDLETCFGQSQCFAAVIPDHTRQAAEAQGIERGGRAQGDLDVACHAQSRAQAEKTLESLEGYESEPCQALQDRVLPINAELSAKQNGGGLGKEKACFEDTDAPMAQPESATCAQKDCDKELAQDGQKALKRLVAQLFQEEEGKKA